MKEGGISGIFRLCFGGSINGYWNVQKKKNNSKGLSSGVIVLLRFQQAFFFKDYVIAVYPLLNKNVRQTDQRTAVLWF